MKVPRHYSLVFLVKAGSGGEAFGCGESLKSNEWEGEKGNFVVVRFPGSSRSSF
jgi:hypothetical protein